MSLNYLAHHGIKGMRWGVRRYQNKDGTLTKAGQKRYERDIRENLAKKKENRIDTSEPDPKRYATEDLKRAKNIADSGNKLVSQFQQVERSTRPQTDLSHMTDQQLRDRINRMNLERQYSEMIQDTTSLSKGRQFTKSLLDNSNVILGTTASALGVALAIKELRG